MLPLSPDFYIQVNDIRTRYWGLGTRGSVVILIHGIGSAIESWALNIEVLAQHHRVYALDLVGSGHSDKPMGFSSLVAIAQFVNAFADALNLDRFSLVGNSLGGGVALQLALAYPQRVEKLVLVDSLGLGSEISWSLRVANLPWVDRFYKPTRGSTALTLKQTVADSSLITDEWIDLFYKLLSLPGAPEAMISQIRTNVGWAGVRPEVYQPIVNRLPTLTMPTLVVWGKQDQILPIAHAQVAMQRLPNAQLHSFDRCGHWSHFEKAAEFNMRVANFLTSSS